MDFSKALSMVSPRLLPVMHWASAVIGGASLTGGEGTMVGVLIGAALLALIRNSLDILGWGEYWQDLIIGAVIVITVSFDQLRRRLRRV